MSIHNEISNLSLGLARVESSMFKPENYYNNSGLVNNSKQIGKQNASATKLYRNDELSMSR